MNGAREGEWSALLELSAAMLEAARAEQWATVLRLQDERRAGLERFFVRTPSREEADAVAAGIRQMLGQDREIMERGAVSHAEARRALERLSTGRRAVMAYRAAG